MRCSAAVILINIYIDLPCNNKTLDLALRVIYQNVCPILAEDETTTEETTESKFASAAEDVLTMVKGAKQLREGVREAEEVKDVLLEPPVAEADKKQEKKKVSHFQAMALMGKLFFGLKRAEGPASEGAEDEESSYEDEEDDDYDEDDEEVTMTETDDQGSRSGESGEGHGTHTQVQVVIEKEDSSREKSSESSTPIPKITHFQAVSLLSRLFAKIRAQHNEIIVKGAKAASGGGGGGSSSSEWTEPLSASDPSTETGASSSSSRCVLINTMSH